MFRTYYLIGRNTIISHYSKINIINYKPNVKSIIIYEKPKSQLLVIPYLPTSDNYIKKLFYQHKSIQNYKYNKVAFLFISGLSMFSIYSYVYIIVNDLTLIFM